MGQRETELLGVGSSLFSRKTRKNLLRIIGEFLIKRGIVNLKKEGDFKTRENILMGFCLGNFMHRWGS